MVNTYPCFTWSNDFFFCFFFLTLRFCLHSMLNICSWWINYTLINSCNVLFKRCPFYCFIHCWLSMRCQNIFYPPIQGVDGVRPLEVPCDVWHQDVCRTSCKFCTLKDGGAAADREFSSSNTLNSSDMFFTLFLKSVCSVAECIILLIRSHWR